MTQSCRTPSVCRSEHFRTGTEDRDCKSTGHYKNRHLLEIYRSDSHINTLFDAKCYSILEILGVFIWDTFTRTKRHWVQFEKNALQFSAFFLT